MELLFAILLILSAAVVGYYFLARWGREKVQGEARLLSGALRSFENQYRQLLSKQQDHSPEDPEPYGSQARSLKQSSDRIGQQLYTLREQYIRIQQRLPRKDGSLLQPFLVSPVLLVSLHKEMAGVGVGLDQEQANLAQVEQQARDMDGLGWQEAQQARQAAAVETELDQRVQALQARKAHGTAFEALVFQDKHVQDLFGTIPEYFWGADQAAVLKQADKASVIQAYQALGEACPLQEQVERQLQEWEKRLAILDEKLSRLRQNLDGLEQSLDTLPGALDVSTIKGRYELIQAEVQRLQVHISRPELERLAGVEAAVDQQLEAIQELDAQARHARQGQAALEQVLLDIGQGLKQLSAQYSALGTEKSYRVLWSRTSNTLASLSQQVSDLGPAERKRTPAKLDQDLEKANQLAVAQKELALNIQKVADQHTELLNLLEGPELSQALLWAQSSQKILQQVREYHPDNWPRADGVNNLPAELQTVTEGLQRLGSGRPGEGVAEAQLPQRLEEARRLAQDYQTLRGRFNVVEARLAELQQSETQARDILEGTRKDLVQLAFIVNSNPTLTKMAGQEIGRFQAQIDKQSADLDQRQQGTVDSKARQASGLAVRINQGLNGWLDQLGQDTQAKVKGLTASLTRLDSIAPLEDAPVAEARRLLASGPTYGSAYGQKSQFPMEALVLEYKRRSECAQACSAAQQALQDLENPVVESYNTASESRQKVQDQFSAANNWLRQARSWPPVAVDGEAEYQALGRLEADWADVKTKPVKAIDLVKRLGDLAREYQGLAEKTRQLIERGNRDQKEVQKFETELDGFLSLWEKLQLSYQDNIEASEDIHKLLNEADQEMYRIKIQSREGVLTYDQVLQAIQTLHRKVRLYQAVLDDAHVVDVNGRVITSREAKRAPGEW